MKEIINSYKQTCFQINPNIVKDINKLDLSLNEFLLLLYFINVSNKLDLNNIKEYIGLNEEVVLNLFNSLIEKKLIEVIVNKDKNTIDEEISLDLLYNKLIMLKNTQEEVNSDIFAKFESEFGRTLSPIEYEMINSWLDNNVNEETILSALKEAVINGVSNLRYIDKIIYEWTKKGNQKTRYEKEENEEIFDYDWLDEK